MFERTFKNIDDVLWKEAGCSSELDYIEQASWMLFLKYLDDFEQKKADAALATNTSYQFNIEARYRWSTWTNLQYESDKLLSFVTDELFPYLRDFKQKTCSPHTMAYKLGEIFGEIGCKFQSGESLQEALALVDTLSFGSQAHKHELSALYEVKIKNMGNAGRNGGEYYTPRPLIRAMLNIVNPQIGERIYDPSVGSAGFLCEASDYIRSRLRSEAEEQILKTDTLFGNEKKNLAYVIATMNLILHGIETPNIKRTNTLRESIDNLEEENRFDVILANPPFGGRERKDVQENFSIKTSETAFLFLQHCIKKMKTGGRAAIVIKNTFLSNTDHAACSLRKEILLTCNLHTILDCPNGTFQGAGVKTVVLFFEKGKPTESTWFYQLDPGRKMGKTNPLNDNDLKDFLTLQKDFRNSDKSWAVGISELDKSTFDLAPRNPNAQTQAKFRDPKTILEEMASLDNQSSELITRLRALL